VVEPGVERIDGGIVVSHRPLTVRDYFLVESMGKV
jgi:hypothetical protein